MIFIPLSQAYYTYSPCIAHLASFVLWVLNKIHCYFFLLCNRDSDCTLYSISYHFTICGIQMSSNYFLSTVLLPVTMRGGDKNNNISNIHIILKGVEGDGGGILFKPWNDNNVYGTLTGSD